MSSDSKYLEKGEKFKDIMHISDWLPTILAWNNKSEMLNDIKMDGIDQSKVSHAFKLQKMNNLFKIQYCRHLYLLKTIFSKRR